MSEWKEFYIEDFAEVLNHMRVPLSSTDRNKRKGNFPYYGASGIIDSVDDYLFDGEHVLVSEDGENLRSRKTPIAFLANDKFWVNNHVHILKGKKDFYNKLIVYYFVNLDLNPFITGAVQPKLNKASLLSIPMFLPEDEGEQRSIASILSSLDDKIDMLHRQNATLEKMAETLFRQWFVEEAKDDWEEGTLDNVLSVKGGSTPSTKIAHFWDGDIHWTSPRDITKLNGIFLFETERKITEEGLKKISSGLLPNGTLLMSSRAPVGVLAFAEVPLAINQGYIAILNDKGFSKEFIYLWLKINMEYVQSHANGSTFLEISKSAFRSLQIVMPPKELRTVFQKNVKPFFDKIRTNTTQVRTLKKMRDTILPKLMSGEVKVET